jgi:hypothetical protein
LVRAKETNDLPVKSEKSPIPKTTPSVRRPIQCNIERIIGTKVRILQLLALLRAGPLRVNLRLDPRLKRSVTTASRPNYPRASMGLGRTPSFYT